MDRTIEGLNGESHSQGNCPPSSLRARNRGLLWITLVVLIATMSAGLAALGAVPNARAAAPATGQAHLQIQQVYEHPAFAGDRAAVAGSYTSEVGSAPLPDLFLTGTVPKIYSDPASSNAVEGPRGFLIALLVLFLSAVTSVLHNLWREVGAAWENPKARRR